MQNGTVWTYYEHGWWYSKVVGEGRNRTDSRYKYEEVAKGRALAKQLRTEHFITNERGQIEERNSYGNDPVKSRG